MPKELPKTFLMAFVPALLSIPIILAVAKHHPIKGIDNNSFFKIKLRVFSPFLRIYYVFG